MTYRTHRGIAATVALLLSLLGFAPPIEAKTKKKTCGGDEPCVCGSRVQGAAKLDEDLTGCAGIGLKLKAGAKLDCNGHAIQGLGEESSQYGILVDGADGAEVTGCTVSGFERGIRVRGSKGVKITKNTVRENETGIETSGSTKKGQVIDVVIAENVLERNELDGVHLGVGSLRPRVTRNHFIKNGQESLNLCECVQCEITENVVEDSGTAGIYARNVRGAYFADNVLKRSFFYLRGDSTKNVIARNEIEDGFYLLGGYTGRGFTNDPGWVKVPHDNEIIGGSVSGKKFCFRFKGAADNRVQGVVTDDCKPVKSEEYGDFQAVNNVLRLREAGDDFDADGIVNVSDECTDVDGDGFGDPGFKASTCKRDN
ncbi:MAG: right-handed parallel beta-helix repeat-containing protein [Deltaproteobacteria bacterium]|nr:right-handed parallel beta-helix repeat-containing protein [Deltaproteobacteria bacterium]